MMEETLVIKQTVFPVDQVPSNHHLVVTKTMKVKPKLKMEVKMAE